MAPDQTREVGFTTPILWLFATLLGMGLPPFLFLIIFIADTFNRSTTLCCGLPFVMGASMGVAQWLVLRRHFQGIGAWISASTLGGGVGFSLGGGIPLGFVYARILQAYFDPGQPQNSIGDVISSLSIFPTIAVLLLIGLLLGLAVGISQWNVLRRYVRYAGWWPAVNSVAFALTPALVLVPPYFSKITGETLAVSPVIIRVCISLALTLPGVVTGTAMIMLLKESRPVPSSQV